jgi:glycine/D-amino acid oxidase-like deaminating enzyme
MSRDELVAYFERYAAGFEAQAPVLEGVAVTSLHPGSNGGFRLETTAGPLAAQTVVLSTGLTNGHTDQPERPPFPRASFSSMPRATETRQSYRPGPCSWSAVASLGARSQKNSTRRGDKSS